MSRSVFERVTASATTVVGLIVTNERLQSAEQKEGDSPASHLKFPQQGVIGSVVHLPFLQTSCVHESPSSHAPQVSITMPLQGVHNPPQSIPSSPSFLIPSLQDPLASCFDIVNCARVSSVMLPLFAEIRSTAGPAVALLGISTRKDAAGSIIAVEREIMLLLCSTNASIVAPDRPVIAVTKERYCPAGTMCCDNEREIVGCTAE